MRLSGLQQSDYGCLALAGVVVAIEIAGAKNQQMISHAVARHKRAHPVLTTTVVLASAAMTVGHLLEWIDPEVDPFHRAYGALRFLRHMIHTATPTNTTTITGN